MGDILLPVVADTVLGSDFFCSQVLGVCDSPHYQYFPSEDFVKSILNRKPKALTANDYLNKLYAKMKIQTNKPRRLLRAVQISDPHIDFEYTVGTINDCGLPLCCRPENGFTSDPALSAKYWGDYKCDLPHNTLVNMLEYVRDDVKPDMFIWTGDNSAHTVWKNTLEEVIDYTLNITDTIKQVFGEAPIQVFPIQGNHDTWPVNVQDFSDKKINIPINTYKVLWEDWLDKDTVEKYEDYGYYSQTLKLKDGTVYENTKILGLNLQSCNNMNW